MLGLAQPEAPDSTIIVFDSVRIEHDADLDEAAAGDGQVIRDQGQTVERTLDLPPAPKDQRDAQRITATVSVRPVAGEGRRPGDVWTRLGSVSVVTGDDPEQTIELMRFTTGFGGRGVFTQDLTPLAPLLHDRRTLQLTISTWMKPAWEVDLVLDYRGDDVGHRRPVLAVPLFNEPAITAEDPERSAAVVIPEGLSMPRLRVLSTGHSTEGGPENEFVTATHVLSIDGREVARWRPWCVGKPGLRDRNPWAGRRTLGGRELRSSDLDRSGWNPGLVVEPLVIPAPELVPGGHEIELRILGLRPEDRDHGHGYWRVSAVVVADEPWPGN